MSREEDIIRAVEGLLGRCRRIYDQVLLKYPNDDLRPVFVAAPGNALRSYHLFYAMVLSTITHEPWWQQQFGLAQLRDIERGAVKNLDTTTRFAFFVFFLSHVEWSMRKLVTHISPGACKNGGADFKSVHDHVLTTLGLKAYIPLYDLCRTVRNSVHSNAIYIDKNGNDIQINWKGVDYKFKHLQPVDFMTHELGLELYGDLIDSIEGILAHPVVATPAVMQDRLV